MLPRFHQEQPVLPAARDRRMGVRNAETAPGAHPWFIKPVPMCKTDTPEFTMQEMLTFWMGGGF